MNPILYFIIYAGFIIELFFAYPVVFFSCKNNFICIIKIVAAKMKEDDDFSDFQNEQE